MKLNKTKIILTITLIGIILITSIGIYIYKNISLNEKNYSLANQVIVDMSLCEIENVRDIKEFDDSMVNLSDKFTTRAKIKCNINNESKYNLDSLSSLPKNKNGIYIKEQLMFDGGFKIEHSNSYTFDYYVYFTKDYTQNDIVNFLHENEFDFSFNVFEVSNKHYGIEKIPDSEFFYTRGRINNE